MTQLYHISTKRLLGIGIAGQTGQQLPHQLRHGQSCPEMLRWYDVIFHMYSLLESERGHQVN